MARHYVGSGNTLKAQTPEELAAILADPEQAAAYVGNAENARRFRDEYARRMMADGSIQEQIREQAQMVMAGMMKGGGGAPPAPLAPPTPAQSAAYNKAAPGAHAEGIFDSLGDLFSSVSWRKARDRTAADKLARVTEVMNSFGSDVPADGGFLVPETMRSDIMTLTLEKAIVRPRATVLPMSSLKLSVPSVDADSHESSLFGGVEFTWTEEGADIPESQASFGRTKLEAAKLAGFFGVPNELVADSPAFTAWLRVALPAGLAFAEDKAFMTGTGAGQPAGFVGCDAAVTVAKESGQPAASIVIENLAKIYSRMLPESLGTAVWIASIDTFPELATMGLAVGTGGGPVWLGNTNGVPSAAAAPPMTIYGRPVYFTEKTPVLGTAGDLTFADLSKYLIGDRQMVSLTSSEHFLYQSDKTAFRITERADGRPWMNSPVTPANGGPDLSGFVQLADRS